MLRITPALLLTLALLLAACTAADDPPPDAEVRGAAASPTATPTTEATRDTLRVAIEILDAAERDAVRAAIEGQPNIEIVADPAGADAVLTDRERQGATAYPYRAWTAIVHQRHDVLDVTREQLDGLLAGRTTDWVEVGGGSRPVDLIGDAAAAPLLASTLTRQAPTPGAANQLSLLFGLSEDAVGYVADTRGALGLVPFEDLRIGVLALVIDGYDPYRDDPADSPLMEHRYVTAPDSATADRLADLTGWPAAMPPAPVGLLGTGELIPARCVDEELQRAGDVRAMFDGTREALQAADLTVMQLETPLTDLSPPTPCTPTFTLQGRAEVVDAVAEAGIDLLFTIGNHMMDCWNGCPPGEALRDTLERLHAAGIVTTGAGMNLEEARTPAMIEVDGVTFAFLGYDQIAPWYSAGPGSPGTAPFDLDIMLEDVRAAAEIADHVVVGFSWGIEYVADPNEIQRNVAGALVDAGATIILGNHPHWVQALEVIDGAVVAYALGNFIFDQPWSIETQEGMIIELGVYADRIIGYRLRPVFIHERHRPEFTDPAGGGRPVLDRVWDASDRLPAR